MPTHEETEKFECAKMPDVLDAVFSEENMPRVTPAIRDRIRDRVAMIEGSNEESGMTCVATEDYPRLTNEMMTRIADGTFEGYMADKGSKSVRGLIRSMNRHCDECLAEGCKNRVALTRDQITAMSKSGVYLYSRKLKVRPPLEEVGPSEATVEQHV